MHPAGHEATSFTGTLEAARRDLLDLGLRNTLLNYRPLRAKGVEVVDENPVEVFRLLVEEEKPLTFLAGEPGAPPAGTADAEDLLEQPEDERNGAARHKDLRLQTSYSPAQLQSPSGTPSGAAG